MCCKVCPLSCRPRTVRNAFTLIELLTVVAIIALLIGILVPSLGHARDSAKRVKTKATMKSIGDGLESFVGELPNELKGNNYPASKAADDPTVDSGGPEMFGAQWVVRYLLGRDFKGYVPPSQMPSKYLGTTQGYEQVGWYDEIDADNPNPNLQDPNITIPRAGPYITTDAAPVKAPSKLNSRTNPPADPNIPRESDSVFVDTFDMPILYYAADSKHASSSRPNIVTAHQAIAGVVQGYSGIYTFSDNAFFTGGVGCGGNPGLCIDFSATNGAKACLLADKLGPLEWGLTSYESTPPPGFEEWRTEVNTKPNSFAAYLLDRGAFETSGEKTIMPVRRDSYILVSPGKDGMFGTKDDIKNWD